MLNNLTSLALVVCILVFGAQAVADYQDGTDAFKSGDYATALRELQPFADKGDALAQVSLALMYRYGLGVTEDYKAAIKWYKLAAERDDVWAQSSLASMYATGDGVIQDFVLAHMWFSMSELNGRERAPLYIAKVIAKVEAMMTGEQIVMAKELARECVAKNHKNC